MCVCAVCVYYMCVCVCGVCRVYVCVSGVCMCVSVSGVCVCTLVLMWTPRTPSGIMPQALSTTIGQTGSPERSGGQSAFTYPSVRPHARPDFLCGSGDQTEVLMLGGTQFTD